MNKSNIRQKRSLGKESPLSKRPKLDFTSRPKEHVKAGKCNSKESPKSCNRVSKERVSSTSVRKNVQEHTPTSSDWDDEFSGDMLEKVCLIADLSQAMVNSQSVPKNFEKEKINFEIFEGNKTLTKPKSPCESPESSEKNYENLKLEFEKLKEKLKTKEGEVHILRSQLKQNDDAKQAVALQNIKVIEEIQKSCNEKISFTEKELESTKSKLLFRDLEYKTLSERCRQLEYNLGKSKLSDCNSARSLPLSQVAHQKPHAKEIDENNQNLDVDDNFENPLLYSEFPAESCHEGQDLAKLICPEFFKDTNETNIVAVYNFHSGIDNHRACVDFDKKETYEWSNFPKQTVFIKDLYDSVSSLFTCNNFIHKTSQRIVELVVDSCMKILMHLKEVLLFLEELQLCSDYDKADQFLLQNEEEVELATVKSLIDGEKLSKEECGIEGRRSLALICALIKTSQFALNLVTSKPNFMELLKSLATAIGTLRRPLRYNGILIGITLILQKILKEKNLTKEFLVVINETVEEIIFSRPKLDVLIELVNVLTAGKHHLDFLMSLCRQDSSDSCTLYLDCKLKQAMFFTKGTCPLKLLCMQIMGLSCLPSSKSSKWIIIKSIINWLNSTMNTPYYRKIKWLPINSSLRQEHCFNVSECFSYLLTLCLKDYLEVSSQESIVSKKNDIEMKKVNWISVIGEGSVLLKRILKADQRYLNDNNYSLRFAMLLKAYFLSKSDLCQKTYVSSLSSLQVEAITWITDSIESDLRNQDCCLKQNTSALSDIDFFNSLKIRDDPKIT